MVLLDLRLGLFDLGRRVWYNRYMNETRKEIETKLDVKRGSADKLQTKADNLTTQGDMYLAAIEEYREKIAKLEVLVKQRKENAELALTDAGIRAGEADHMQEILDRYDKAEIERSKTVEKIQERIEKFPDWMPGMDESLRGGYLRDAQYKKLVARREYLDTVLEGALPDVKKIFYSRGVVSSIHEKGRKGV